MASLKWPTGRRLRTSSCLSSVVRAALLLVVLLVGAAVGLAVGAFVAGVGTEAIENVLPASIKPCCSFQ